MINWILQSNLTKPSVLERIKAALDSDGAVWEEVVVIPFSNKIPKIKNSDYLKIVYGSTTFMLSAYANSELNEGVFFDPAKFKMSNYVDKWKDEVLNHNGKLLKFGDLSTFESKPTTKWFIRPNNDGKEFAGKVEIFEDLVNWSNKVCKLGIPELNKLTEVWITEPKEIAKEWRLFIVDDEIISASRYMSNGKIDECQNDVPNEMIDFANERIKEYRIDDVYVMDIAELDKEYKLIECNCFNGTGFYHHDIEKIVHSINRFMITQTQKSSG